VLLASAIAVLLLAGVYAAFDVTLMQTQIAREQAADADLARAVANRLSLDLSASLGAMPPRSGGGVPTTTTAPSTGTTSSTETGTTTSSSSGTTTTSSSSSTTTSDEVSDTQDPDAAVKLAADVPFQAGVIGTERQLSLFASRLPQFLSDRTADPTAVLPADLRRVIYYVGSNGGLCRQERPWVTADGVRNSSDPDRSTEDADLIAPEVVDATFEYLDGGTWQSSWDGSQSTTDGTSVMGPPRAIAVTLVFASGKQVRQVFAVRAANGLFSTGAAPAPPTEPTEGGTP
jgi:hypothetical protein